MNEGGRGYPIQKFFDMSHIMFDISTEPVRNGEAFWWRAIDGGLPRLVPSNIYQKYWYTIIWQLNHFNVNFNMKKYQPEACMVHSVEKKLSD